MTHPTAPALHAAIQILANRQMVFDHTAHRAAILRDMAAIDPEHMLLPFGKDKSTIFSNALLTADPEIVAGIVDSLMALPSQQRLCHASPPPISKMHPSDTTAMLAQWKTVFEGGRDLAQQRWFLMAREAITHENNPALQWVLVQPTYWGDREDWALDAAENLLNVRAAPDLRPVLVDALERAFSKLNASVDTPDMRKRHNLAFWIIGCLRKGWVSPTHSRMDIFVQIVEHTKSHHAILDFRHQMGAWQDWVGLDKATVESQIQAIMRPRD